MAMAGPASVSSLERACLSLYDDFVGSCIGVGPVTRPPKLAVTMSLATAPEPPVPYVDRKRHAWVLSLAVPTLVGLGPALYAAWPRTSCCGFR